jgi:hypothetical protein
MENLATSYNKVCKEEIRGSTYKIID